MNSERLLTNARNSLLSYAVLQNQSYEIANHHIRIAKALEAVERGEISRLIITIPPRHGKSMLVSQYFPAWYSGRNPDKYLINATYGQDLASDFGRKVRDQIKDHLFRGIFPDCQMRGDTSASNRFAITKGGEYFAVGVGGPITGRGAHILLIDDPHKNREEADSAQIRKKICEWYTSTAYTRLMPGGAIVIVMTRWHEEDLVGYVLNNHAHEGWVVIDMPAINEHGEALWPERYSIDDLQNIRSTMPDYDWFCLYQQNPIPKEGNLFKAEWLINGLPSDGQFAAKFMSIDPAISKKEKADETAFSVWGVGYERPAHYYEIETVYGKFSFDEQLRIGKELYEKHELTLFGVESVAFQKALADEFTRMGLPCVELKADGDKVRRAMSVSHFFSQGRAHVNTPKLKEQMLRFRGVDGDKDDLVDAAVNCLRLIKSHSSEYYTRHDDRYQHLDPRSKAFWKSHYGESQGTRSHLSEMRQVFGQ